MHIVQLTPGTGNFYCGSCLRDNALVAALRKLGHDALMIPMYLPHAVDEASQAEGEPIFFGGINVYLQQKSTLFRHTPGWLDRIFDSGTALGFAGTKAGMTKADELGEITLSMLKGEEGNQAKELDKLISWLRELPRRPDVISLSNSLLLGVARRIRTELEIPVVCSLQGEDSFLDSLPEPPRQNCWETLRERARDVARFIAPSRYYMELMRERMELSPGQISVVYNGINLEGYEAGIPPERATIGFMARMCPDKGLHILVDAFIELCGRNPAETPTLKIAGSKIAADAAFVEELRGRLQKSGLSQNVEWLPNLNRAEKQTFLRGLSMLSVPAIHGEAFGLYILEALASGVPVVQPRVAAFPELIEITGGGILYNPGDASALATALESLLHDPQRARELGANGSSIVREKFTSERMAQGFARECGMLR